MVAKDYCQSASANAPLWAKRQVVANSAWGSSSRILATALVFLLMSQLPAFADHVHHLWYNNSTWQDQDLTTLTGGPSTYGFDAIAAFYTTPNQQLHVFYVDATAGHVHQLYYNNTNWSDTDLSALTGGPESDGLGVSGFAIGNFQYVFYTGLFDGHVHELSYVDSWTDQDLTATVGGPTVAFGNVTAFATKPNNQFHVYYEDFGGDTHQLYFNGTSWTDQDLSAMTHAYCYGSIWITGLATGNLQHLFCPGYFSGNPGYVDLMHIYYNNSTWTYEDVTRESGSADLYIGTGEAAFAVGNQGEAYAITTDTHVHQYTYKKGHWTDLDLSFRDGAPNTFNTNAMVAFHTPVNNQYHIYYAPGTNLNQQYGDVYQLYFNGTAWAVNNLTGGAGQADAIGGMAGFPIGNLQHVFYLANGN